MVYFQDNKERVKGSFSSQKEPKCLVCISHHGFPHVAVHGLCDIRSVDRVVVGVVAVVVLLDHDQEPPEFDHVQLVELHQAILIQQVEGQSDQAVS